MNSTIPLTKGTPHNPIAHYVALLLPTEIGDWRVLFPDIADCEARGFTVQDATYAAATALVRCARAADLPLPRSLVQIESDHTWFTAKGVALSDAVVTMVPLWSRRDTMDH